MAETGVVGIGALSQLARENLWRRSRKLANAGI
jgi:hypothetical protein